MAEEESMVCRRTASRFTRPRAPGFSAQLLIAALAVFLAGCAPQLAARGTESRAPVLTDDHFVTRDGLSLFVQQWRAENPKAILVALHGMNDYSHAFALPAPYWAEQGITTLAYDQRGFGRSPHTGLWPGDDVLRQDLHDFVDAAHKRYPGLPVYVLGESMGGAVAMTAFASADPPAAQGLILVAPAVWGSDTMPFTYRTTLWLGAHTLPWYTLTGSGLNIWPSDNLQVLRENARDPLFIKGTRIDAIYGLVHLMSEADAAADKLNRTPLLFLYGGKDQIIPADATHYVLERISQDGVKEYPDGYHMLLRDLKAAPRWADIARWITEARASAQ
jgi:alpha-beta hydrolase superfamily lysophospholipase